MKVVKLLQVDENKLIETKTATEKHKTTTKTQDTKDAGQKQLKTIKEQRDVKWPQTENYYTLMKNRSQNM